MDKEEMKKKNAKMRRTWATDPVIPGNMEVRFC